MYYFAYGSNMLTARLARRVPTLKPVGAACLAGHRLSFAMRGGDGSGKCNVAPVAGDSVVHGVLFELDAARLERLHAAEGPGYAFVRLPVGIGGGTVQAGVYRGRGGWLDDALLPFVWYLRFVVGGAREHGLPDAYVQALARTTARRDRNLLRAWRNGRIYRHRPGNVRGGDTVDYRG